MYVLKCRLRINLHTVVEVTFQRLRQTDRQPQKWFHNEAQARTGTAAAPHTAGGSTPLFLSMHFTHCASVLIKYRWVWLWREPKKGAGCKDAAVLRVSSTELNAVFQKRQHHGGHEVLPPKAGRKIWQRLTLPTLPQLLQSGATTSYMWKHRDRQ